MNQEIAVKVLDMILILEKLCHKESSPFLSHLRRVYLIRNKTNFFCFILVGFSYNRAQKFVVPNRKKGMKALVTGIITFLKNDSKLDINSLSCSAGQTKIRKIHCSTSSTVPSNSDHEYKVAKEPIVLSRYSGGFIPDPTAPKKIESLDWPAPIASQVVPELMKFHRNQSESNSDHNQTISDDNNRRHCSNKTCHIEKRHNKKLEKDINEMSKLKDSSGMAHALLENLRLHEKIISKQLPLDPWKASRSPSAAIEPSRRCRFISPKFASPSRRIHTHSSSIPNKDDSLAGLSTLMSTTPTGQKHITLSRDRQQHEIPLSRPDDSLSPLLKVQTLCHQLDIQKVCDTDSTINSCCKRLLIKYFLPFIFRLLFFFLYILDSNDRGQDKLEKVCRK